MDQRQSPPCMFPKKVRNMRKEKKMRKGCLRQGGATQDSRLLPLILCFNLSMATGMNHPGAGEEVRKGRPGQGRNDVLWSDWSEDKTPKEKRNSQGKEPQNLTSKQPGKGPQNLRGKQPRTGPQNLLEVGIIARGTCTEKKRYGTPCGEGATEKRGGCIPFREGVKGYVEMKKNEEKEKEKKRKRERGCFLWSWWQ